jgi:hypothetical protein
MSGLAALYKPIRGKRRQQMLFMSIYTYDAEHRDAVSKRRAEKGALTPAGVKVIGEWSSAAGHRVFRLTEVEDAKALFTASRAWTDLGNIETYPVIPTDEVMKLLGSEKK